MADQAVKGIEAAWKETVSGAVEGEISGRSVQAGKLCAAVVRVVAPKAESAANPILINVMRRYLQRNFTVLQIGTTL